MARKVRKDRQGRVLKQGESQRSDGHYTYRYTNNKGERITIYGKDLIELREREKEIKKNEFFNIDYSIISLNKLHREYMKNVKWQSLAKTTIEVYQSAWENHIQNTIGKKKVKDIKRSEIINFYIELQKEKKLKKQRLTVIHSLLKTTFDYAIGSEIIYNNPCTNALSYIKEERTKGKRVIPENEQHIIAEYLRNHPKYNYNVIANLFILGCNSGLRIGEILALTWADIDFKNEVINVSKSLKTVSNKITIGKPKTKNSTRQVPMLSNVKKALHSQRVMQFEKGNNNFELDGYTNFVFINSKGKLFKPVDINSYFNSVREGCKDLVIDHFSSHCMRHTFCTRLIKNNVNIKAVQSLMGHSDIKTTLNVYTHDSIEQNKEELKKLEPESIAL